MQVKICEVCGKRAARYICQECGRKVCQSCLELPAWICLECYTNLKRGTSLESFQWSPPLKLFLFGFVLMFVGTIIMMIATIFFGAPMEGGTTIWIFPLPPIGFGIESYAFWAISLSVALKVLSLILFIVLRKRAR